MPGPGEGEGGASKTTQTFLLFLTPFSTGNGADRRGAAEAAIKFLLLAGP